MHKTSQLDAQAEGYLISAKKKFDEVCDSIEDTTSAFQNSRIRFLNAEQSS